MIEPTIVNQIYNIFGSGWIHNNHRFIFTGHVARLLHEANREPVDTTGLVYEVMCKSTPIHVSMRVERANATLVYRAWQSRYDITMMFNLYFASVSQLYQDYLRARDDLSEEETNIWMSFFKSKLPFYNLETGTRITELPSFNLGRGLTSVDVHIDGVDYKIKETN